MTQISRDQRKTLGKFIDIAFRRRYLIDWDLWDLQVDFAPRTGYWSVSAKDAKDAFPRFDEYRNGIAAGIRLGLETVIRMNLKDGEPDMDVFQRYAAPLLQGFHTESRKWPDSHGMKKMRIHTDVFQILEDLPSSVQSSDIFDDYLQVSDESFRDYARDVSQLITEQIRNASDDDAHVTAGLTQLASYAYAYWTAEQWRYSTGERGDEISDEAIEIFMDALNQADELAADKEHYTTPATVTAALLAFMNAYSHGQPPTEPRTAEEGM